MKIITLQERIQSAVDRGLEAFWKEVFKQFDEVEGRDVFYLGDEAYYAVEKYLEVNTTYLD
jgi:hypothetical protein